MTDGDLPEPRPGALRVIRENGHVIEITTVANGPSPSYRLECIDCGDVSAAALLHEATTRPVELVAKHVVNRPRLWPEGLDWDHTGRWAVVMLIAGASGNGWTVHPSLSMSRWESQEHAHLHAQDRRKDGLVWAAVLDWGDDLKHEHLFTNARVRAVLEAQGVSFQEAG